MEIIKSVRAELNLGNKILDCYMFPDGEKRIGITGASEAIGRRKESLGKLLKAESKSAKALRDMGFTGCTKDTMIGHGGKRGASKSKTISVRDFVKLVTWDAIINKSTESIILLAAFSETGLEGLIDKLFDGQSTEFILEKIVHYTKWTYEDLQGALESNYDDWNVIAEQELFLLGA